MGYNLGNAQRVKIQGYEAIIADIDNIRKDISMSVKMTLEDTAEDFIGKLKDALSETRYSIKDLAKADHPYAARHAGGFEKLLGEFRSAIGMKRWSEDDWKNIRAETNPKWGIHERSGDMKRDLSWKYEEHGSVQQVLVGWLSSEAKEYYFYIIYGTRKMLPRPILTLVWEKNDMIEFIRERIIFYHNRGGGTKAIEKERQVWHPTLRKGKLGKKALADLDWGMEDYSSGYGMGF